MTATTPPATDPHPLEGRLRQGLTELNLHLPDGAVAKLLLYLDQLQKWNKVYNLTSVRDPAEMLTHHLLDSLAVLPKFIQAARGMGQGERDASGKDPIRVLDVGSGGGLPGVVLAIAQPSWQVLCVDAVSKKTAFIQQVAATLELPNLRSVHSRVEQLKDGPFDMVTSRAFASLADFVSLTRFHVKHQTNLQGAEQQHPGLWIAMKAKNPSTELAEVAQSATWAKHLKTTSLRVPGLNEERCLVFLQLVPERH